MKSIGSLVRSSLPARGAYARDNTEPPEGGEREGGDWQFTAQYLDLLSSADTQYCARESSKNVQ